jgi:hypothetical protein
MVNAASVRRFERHDPEGESIRMSAELGLSEAENTGSSGTRYMNAPHLAEEAKWKK